MKRSTFHVNVMTEKDTDASKQTDEPQVAEDAESEDEGAVDFSSLKASVAARNVSARGEVPKEHRGTKLAKIHSDLQHHGEVHLIVSEHGDMEAEARLGTTNFDYENGLVEIHAPRIGSAQNFDADEIVRWYKPTQVFHE